VRCGPVLVRRAVVNPIIENMTNRLIRLLAVTVLVASVASAAPQVSTRSAPERLAADAQRATPAGATFTVPAGWAISAGASLVVLDPPEPVSHVAIVDVRAADAAAAVAAAWEAYRPEAKRPLKLAVPEPARNGWDERH
jgi:hypothetical protein